MDEKTDTLANKGEENLKNEEIAPVKNHNFIKKKSERSDSGISLENVDNQDNLNKYIECEKKMDDEILCNLLKNVQKSLPSSGVGSDDEYDEDEYSSNSKVDYKSLIQALSSCNMNKEKVGNNSKQSEQKNESKPHPNKKSNGSEIRDIQEIFVANKNKQNNKKSSSTKVENKNDRDKSTIIGMDTKNLSSAAIMEQLSAKISSMNLAKQQKASKSKSKDLDKKKQESNRNALNIDDKSTPKKDSSSVNCNDKNHVQIIPRDTQNKKDKKYLILLERGPWSKPKTYGVRNANPFYQGNQQFINTNILSGGKFWTAEEPVDLIPKTIPDLEGIISKSTAEDCNVTDVHNYIAPNASSGESSILEDTLTPTAIAAVLEKEVLLFANGIDNDQQTTDCPLELPNWGDYELVKNILEREAGSVDLTAVNDTNLVPPTIVVNEYANTNAVGELNVGSTLTQVDQFIVQSPTSDRLHEVSIGCQRIDQLTPTSQTVTFTFENPIMTHEINGLPQNFELPPTPTDLRSPLPIYSPADNCSSLNVPLSSSNFYSPSPSIYSVNSGSLEQTYITESPQYSKTPSHDQEFFGINNSLMNQAYCSALSFTDTFLTQVSSPNDSLLQRSTQSTSNRSSFCGSDNLSEQCYSSPNAERIENQNYDNMYELSSPMQHRTTRESFSSSSPLESPDIYLDPEELETFSKALSQVNGVPEYIFTNQDTSNDICLQLDSIQNQNTYNSIINRQTYTDNNTQYPGNAFYSQKVDPKQQKAVKCLKVKPVPIAAKQSYPCCDKMKKNAREVLEEMFQRLDENMQSNVLLKVHTLDDGSLMKLLDSLLAGWGCTKLPIPRLPLLYAICERLLMTKTTMVKFFKTYRNGHTVLDRALLTCPQSPILSRYIAECSIKAMEGLHNDKDFTLDKTDSLGNSILHRAVCAGVECAAPLANLLQLNTDGSLLDVNRLNAEGYSPLHVACSIHVQQPGGLVCSCLIMTHIFLEHGKADPNVKDRKSGITALHTAVSSNGCSPALVTLLLKYGADPSIRNYYSSTPLDLAKSACRSSNNPQCAKQVVDILKKLKKPY